MDCVIFWMFLTDFKRMEICFSVAIPRCCWVWANMFPAVGKTEVARCIIFA
jgi:hypothetical protein